MAEFEEEQTQGLPDWLRDPVAILRRRWLPMLGALLFGLAATAVLTALRTPTYLAEATLLLATQQVDEGLVKPTTSGNPIEALDALTAQALSRANLRAVIDELGLYPDLREELSMDQLAGILRAAITVEARQNTARGVAFNMRGERSRLLVIGYEANSATLAATVANRLANLFQAEGLRMRSEQSRLATEFMRTAVVEAEKSLREQKVKIAAYESEHRGELPSDLEVNQRRVERLQAQRDSLMMAATEAETRAASGVIEPSAIDSPEARLGTLKAQLARERGVNRDTHPNVMSLQRQVEAAEAEVASSGGSSGGGGVAAASRRGIAQYRAQIAAIDEELAALDQRIARIPSHEAEIVGLQQRAEALETSLNELMGKLKETELAQNLEQAQQGAQVAVLEEAQPSTAPERGRLQIALAGIVASFGLAVMLAFALELRDPVIATAKGVEALAGVPVLGVIPKLS